MLLYRVPLVEQSVINTNDEVKTLNVCWLYAVIIASCNTPELEEFAAKKQMLVNKMQDTGISSENINAMIQRGAGFTPEKCQTINGILGITHTMSLNDITGEFASYKKASNKEKRSIYTRLYNILNDVGPLVLEYPAFGFKAIHRTAVTGILLGKSSKDNQEEIFFLVNDTMDCRIKAIPITDFLEKQSVSNLPINFLYLSKQEKKPVRYTTQEIVNLISELPYNRYNFNLKTDLLLELDIDNLIDHLSGKVVTITSSSSNNPKQFFNNSPNADIDLVKDSPEVEAADSLKKDGYCSIN
ncbi:hypothetical protein ACNVED_07020 [Legionella sp. D16C41]|uniref:hypothetical protein n=1 Tax=Legionella sp. D16C41 TaxID=3402688 RepID=UPI003AF5C01C